MKKLLIMIFLVSITLSSCQEDNTSKTNAKSSDSTKKGDSVLAQFGDIKITANSTPPKPEFTQEEIDDYSYMIGYDLGNSLVNEKLKRDYNEFVNGLADQFKGNKFKYSPKEMTDIKNRMKKIVEVHFKNVKPENYAKTEPPVLPDDLYPKYSYVQGTDIAKDMFQASAAYSIEQIKQGVLDASVAKPSRLTEERRTAVGEKYTNLVNYMGFLKQKEWEEKGKLMKEKGDVFYEKAKKSGHYVEDKEGFLYKILKPSKGKQVQKDDLVSIHVRLFHMDSTVIDDSYKRGTPLKVPLERTMRAFAVAVPKMTVGSKWRIIAPPVLVFGERGMPPDFYPNEPVTFEIEVISIDGKSKDLKEPKIPGGPGDPGMPGGPGGMPGGPGGMMPPQGGGPGGMMPGGGPR